MFFCDETLTLYNAYFDKANECTAYERTVIKGISWYGTLSVSVDKEGLNSAYTFTIRVPEDADFGGKHYVKPSVYKTIGTEGAPERSDVFTLDAGDIMVRGEVADVAPTAKTLTGKYDDVMTVISVTDDRRGPMLRHWKVEGK